MNFASHEDSGENLSGFTLERRATSIIEWSFDSMSKVNLLIIKKSSLEYYEKVALELATEFGLDYHQLMREFLEDDYVSKDQYIDSGKFTVSSSGVYYIWFRSSGTIKYHIKWDPFSIDIMSIFYGILGFVTFMGIIYSIIKTKKLLNMKTSIEKNNSDQELSHDYHPIYYCNQCGENLDSGSIYCHTCGLPLIPSSNM